VIFARLGHVTKAEVADPIAKLGFHGIDLGLPKVGGRAIGVPGGGSDGPEPGLDRLSAVP
jgi:hypothetical protein